MSEFIRIDNNRGIVQPVVQTTEAPAFAHAHYFQTITDVTLDHAHRMELFTYPVNGNSTDGHVHTFQGHTLMADGHFHRYVGTTGPAVGLPNGEHYHRIVSRVDDEPFITQGNFYTTILTIPRHTHTYSGVTGRGIGSAVDPESVS
ncbi:YmaF family protein [Paenibacillus sp. UNCCL117]|uniref:YmaF family protein n=1 Tax=unclassified Paenibacillus TaxID=185978 RepID=UPI000888D536|nr:MULTISPECIES: YmaF family protein [unclassified Paenibacillus]SDC89121.1 YmaF family protein [Paenibacillus sp. cl123]SFW28478.1 YmaF family protein [Paenibacillus sp. UNCCL117]